MKRRPASPCPTGTYLGRPRAAARGKHQESERNLWQKPRSHGGSRPRGTLLPSCQEARRRKRGRHRGRAGDVGRNARSPKGSSVELHGALGDHPPSSEAAGSGSISHLSSSTQAGCAVLFTLHGSSPPLARTASLVSSRRMVFPFVANAVGSSTGDCAGRPPVGVRTVGYPRQGARSRGPQGGPHPDTRADRRGSPSPQFGRQPPKAAKSAGDGAGPSQSGRQPPRMPSVEGKSSAPKPMIAARKTSAGRDFVMPFLHANGARGRG